MSKFFLEQLARIIVGQINNGDLERAHPVPIIDKVRLLKAKDILSFRFVKVSFEKIEFPVEGLDKSYSFTHSKVY